MNETSAPPRRFGCLHLLMVAVGAVILTAAAMFFIYRAVLFPPAFKPVQLNDREAKALQLKLDRIGHDSPTSTLPDSGTTAPLEPEAYTEEGATRTIQFTERELNSLLAKNTDLADKLAIDLSKDLVSAKFLLPLDDDLPVLGGKTLRVKAGLAFSYANGKPLLTLRGVTVMGVPLPKAWLGGLKDVDLGRELGEDSGFWKTISAGVENIRIEDGCATVTLNE